ncbi:retrovirus-related pol polyprotein from transposon TNT 1-94 [Tanacetum coccineum]
MARFATVCFTHDSNGCKFYHPKWIKAGDMYFEIVQHFSYKLRDREPKIGKSKMIAMMNLASMEREDKNIYLAERKGLTKTTGQIGKDYLKRSVWYLDSGCSRQVTCVKQYLHRYSKESDPKVVFRDNSSCDTEGYGSVNCNGITFTRVAYVNGLKHNLISISQLCDANFKVLFTKTQGTIFNQNNEVVLITLRRRDVYVIDMSSYNEESYACFFAKASNSVNWLWHKRLSYVNFKNINKLAR